MRLIGGLSSPATYSGLIFSYPNTRTASHSLSSSSSHIPFFRQCSSSKQSRFSVSMSKSKSSPAIVGKEDDETTTYQQLENINVSPKSESDSLSNQVGSPRIFPTFISVPKLSLSDQAFFLLSFITVTTSLAFTSLAFAAVPTLFAMRRAAISFSKLADTAREELPSTMAALRLSGIEISDLTLELTDLSKEIADGVSKSAQAVQAAKAGVRRIGSLAHQHTMSMIEERANLPVISVKTVVAGVAKKTSQAVGQVAKKLIPGNRNDSSSEDN
ncbi:unnamed protein product [Cuscuta epithymum]|uniref:Transmembrane protein n=1 Tax=Cuscuta epithymum TaxID=186058 RepID=A0AAV0C413_9ASTE|nr:unnamed protein product [Cuscuta epithymum]